MRFKLKIILKKQILYCYYIINFYMNIYTFLNLCFILIPFQFIKEKSISNRNLSKLNSLAGAFGYIYFDILI